MNTTEKISGRILSTNNNEIVTVFNDANTGWQYVVVRAEVLPNGDINRVEWVNSSKTYMAQAVESLIKTLYSKAKMPLPSATTCPVIPSRTVLAKDLSLVAYADKMPIELASYSSVDKIMSC